MAITRFISSWRKPEGLDIGEMRRHHDMLLALRYLADHPDEEIWIPGTSIALVEELTRLVEACGGNGNVMVIDRLKEAATPDQPAGRTWSLVDPTKAEKA
jgi:hypothetical protein